MEDNRAEQREALETLVEFNVRLVKNMEIIKKELSGQRLEDTDQFLKSIIDAINWEIQVVNGTMSLLNEGKERINKEAFNQAVTTLAQAVEAKDDQNMAEAFEDVIVSFRGLGEAVKEVLA